MRDSVSKAFKSFNTKFEGYLTYMYGDVKNLVTTGMGNLVDPIGQALSLPWVNSDGSPASQQQITDAWNAVKARTDLNQKGGRAYASVTSIRLTDAGIDQLIQSRLQSNESIIKQGYPGYDSWPADAQLAIHSMAWAMGAAFKFPKFKADVNANPPDFTSAATDGQMNAAGNPGLVPRNTANKKLFENAAAVLKNKADPDTLYYPGDVPAGLASTTTAHPHTTTTARPHVTTTAALHATTTAPPHATTTATPHATTTATPHATTTATPHATTTATPHATTTATPAAATTATPAAATTATPPAATTATPPAATTATPAAATTATPAAATTATPAAATTATPAAATTATPAAATTATPAAATTAAAAATTTASPVASTTAPSGNTTAPPDPSGAPAAATTTTAAPSGATPTVTASIELDPDDGSQQNPNSVQVAKSVKLKIKWSATDADTVDIDGLGNGLAASGEQDIPSQDANYSLVAHGKGGDSQPFNIEVHTHDDGAVVSSHVDLGTGQVAVISFTATKGNQPITSATVGDKITLTAIFSDATKSAKINGQDAALAAQANGQQIATLDVSIDASSDGNFDAQAVGDGTGADLPQHIDIAPAAATSTTAGPGSGTTHAPGTTTSHAPGTTTSHAPGTTTSHAPGTTTSHAPGTTTSHAGTTTTHAPNSTTTHAPSSTTSHAASSTTTHGLSSTTTHAASSSTTHAPSTTTTHAPSTTTTGGDWTAEWSAETAKEDDKLQMVLTAPGLAAGTEVTFEVKQDGVDTPIGTVTATSEAGKATADWSTWFKQEAVGDPQTVNADNGEKFTAVTFSFKASASGKDSTTTKSVAYGDKVTWNLVDPDGKPVPKTLVSVCLPYGTLTVTSDDNGAINLDGLPPGEAHVTVD